MKTPSENTRNPFRSLLAALREPRSGREPNGDAIARGLTALAAQLDKLIRSSDEGRGPVSARDANQIATLGKRQQEDLESLRTLAKEARFTHRARLPRLASAGRSSLLDACRAQVQKLRLFRKSKSESSSRSAP